MDNDEVVRLRTRLAEVEIERTNAVHILSVDLNAALERIKVLEDVLNWLNCLGGLGLDKHARIRAALLTQEPKP